MCVFETNPKKENLKYLLPEFVKEKIKQGYEWVKEKGLWKLVLIGGAIAALGGGLLLEQTPSPPPIIAEGKTIEFPYTDNNSNENLLIYTDKETYNPLWAWRGFDVYFALVNKSGVEQEVSFQSFFSKDFTIEEIYTLDPFATSAVKMPIYEEICTEMATSTGEIEISCVKEKTGETEEILLGVWMPISQEEFVKEDYYRFLLENDIPVKPKTGEIVRGHFRDWSPKDAISYYKLRVKANVVFSQEEFFVEAVGDQQGYGLIDPNIFTDDFNSLGNGTLNGTSSWVADLDYVVQDSVVYEGAKAVKSTEAGGWVAAVKDGTQQAEGQMSVRMRVSSVTTGQIQVQLLTEGDVSAGRVRFNVTAGKADYLGADSGIMGDLIADNFHKVEIKWHSVPSHQVAFQFDSGGWTAWQSPENDWTTGLDAIRFYTASCDSFPVYFDTIAENGAVAAAEPQMNVIIIDE